MNYSIVFDYGAVTDAKGAIVAGITKLKSDEEGPQLLTFEDKTAIRSLCQIEAVSDCWSGVTFGVVEQPNPSGGCMSTYHVESIRPCRLY